MYMCMQVVEKPVDRKVCVRQLSHSLKRLGRSVARRDRASIARKVVADPELVGKIEMKCLCSLVPAPLSTVLSPMIVV